MDEMQIQEVLQAYSGLEYNPDRKLFYGHVDISGNDFYEIEVDISQFPEQFPSVRETGERISRKADRHVYEDTGDFCFTTSAKESILLKKSVKTLLDFFQKILIPFLQNNSYFEINKRYCQGEYAHGLEGVIQAYQDILGINNPQVIIQVLWERERGGKRRPNDLCYCGSRLKIKKCGGHYERYKEFRLVDRRVIASDLNRINEILKALNQAQHPNAYQAAFTPTTPQTHTSDTAPRSVRRGVPFPRR